MEGIEECISIARVARVLHECESSMRRMSIVSIGRVYLGECTSIRKVYL